MKKIFLNISLIFISTVISLFLGEIMFRIYYHYSPHWRDDPKSKYLIPNKYFSHWHPKNFTGRCSSSKGEFDVYFNTNSYGMVDKERQTKKSRELRVAVLGDSYVEGLQVKSEYRFTNIIEKNLEKIGIKIEVLNFGCSWFSPLLERFQFKYLVKYFDPDIVILLLHYTDITDDWYFKDQAVIRGGVVKKIKPNPTLSMIQNDYVQKLRNSALLKGLYRIYREKKQYFIVTDKNLQNSFTAWYKYSLNDEDMKAIHFSSLNISTLINQIGRHCDQIIIAIIPIAETLNCIYNKKNRYNPGSEFTDDEIKNAMCYYEIVKNAVENIEKEGNYDLTFLNFFEPFLKATIDNTSKALFYRFDGHFTTDGHLIVANILEEELVKIVAKN